MNISYNGHRIKVRLVRTPADRITLTFRSIVPDFEGRVPDVAVQGGLRMAEPSTERGLTWVTPEPSLNQV